MDWFSSPIASLISLLTGFIGVVLAIVLYVKSKRDKEPYWSIWTVGLFKNFSSTVEGLEAQYLGDKVKDLSISNVIFWNQGRLTINQSDLTEADPLRLELKGNGRILSTTVIAINNHASRPSLGVPIGNRVLVNFDYLDRGHGFVMRVIHEGTSSDDLQIKGVLKGAAKIRGYDWSSVGQPKKSEFLTIGFLPLLLAGGTFVETQFLRKAGEDDISMILSFVLGAALLVLFITLSLQIFVICFRYSWVPRGLESFTTGPVQVDNKVKT